MQQNVATANNNESNKGRVRAYLNQINPKLNTIRNM